VSYSPVRKLCVVWTCGWLPVISYKLVGYGVVARPQEITFFFDAGSLGYHTGSSKQIAQQILQN
jgi:hypothetical protein